MKDTTWSWTVQKDEAARLIAYGEISNAKVAEVVGVGHDTLYRWKNMPEFSERVQEFVAEISEALAESTLTAIRANAAARLELLDKVARLVRQITPEDLEALMKKNPVAAINLFLRLQNAVELSERRRLSLIEQEQEEDEDDDFPFTEDLDPELAAKMVEVLKEDRRKSGLPPIEDDEPYHPSAKLAYREGER